MRHTQCDWRYEQEGKIFKAHTEFEPSWGRTGEMKMVSRRVYFLMLPKLLSDGEVRTVDAVEEKCLEKRKLCKGTICQPRLPQKQEVSMGINIS